MVNIVVSSTNPNRNSFNISYNEPGQAPQNTQLYQSNDNIDSNELRVFNVADIWKDSISTNTQVTNFPVLYEAITQLFGEQVLPGAVIKNTPRPTWQSVLEEKKQRIIDIIQPNEYEAVFERTKQDTQTQLLTLLNFYESGIGVEKILNRIILASQITIKNPAQALDAGPSGAGNYVFPKVGDTLTFTEYFMTSYGFQNDRKPIPDPVTEDNPLGFPGGWSWSAITLEDQEQGIKGFHFIIQLFLNTFGDLRFDTQVQAQYDIIRNLILGNAVKNNNINSSIIDNPRQIQQAALLVALKELGDAMMNAVYISYFYYIQTRYQTAQEVYAGEGYGECPENVRELSSIQLANLYLTMYTCDATVHYRNVLYGVPSVLTGSKNKINFGIINKPTTMSQHERLKNLLDIEFNMILNNNIDLKSRWVQSSNSLWILNPSRNNRLKNIVLPPDQVENGRNLINLLNAEVVQLKTALIEEINNNLNMGNQDFLIRINVMKQYLCSPFIVPRFIPGEAGGNVQRGCLVDFIIINSVWPEPIKVLARAINDNLSASIGLQRGGSGDKGISDITGNFDIATMTPNGNNNLLFEGYDENTSLTMNEGAIWYTLLDLFPRNELDTLQRFGRKNEKPWSIEGYEDANTDNVRGTYPFLSIIYMLYCRSVWYLQIMTNVNAICGTQFNKEKYIKFAIYLSLIKSSYFDCNRTNILDKSRGEVTLTVINNGEIIFPHNVIDDDVIPLKTLSIKQRQVISIPYNNLLISYFNFVYNEDNDDYVFNFMLDGPDVTIPNSDTRFEPRQLLPQPHLRFNVGEKIKKNTPYRTKNRRINGYLRGHNVPQPEPAYGGTKRKNVYRKRNNNKYTKKNMKKYTNKSAKYPKIVKKTRKTRKNRK